MSSARVSPGLEPIPHVVIDLGMDSPVSNSVVGLYINYYRPTRSHWKKEQNATIVRCAFPLCK